MKEDKIIVSIWKTWIKKKKLILLRKKSYFSNYCNYRIIIDKFLRIFGKFLANFEIGINLGLKYQRNIYILLRIKLIYCFIIILLI